MKALAPFVLLISASVSAQVSTRPPQSGGGGGGGAPSFPLLASVGCTTPAYSFTGRTTLGLCTSAAENVEITATNGTLNSIGHVDTSGSTVEGRFTVTRGVGATTSDLRTQASSSTASFSATGNNSSGSPTKSYSVGASAGTSHQFDFLVSGSAATQTITGLFNAAAASNTFLTFTNVATPANVISFIQDSSLPYWAVNTEDGTRLVSFSQSNGAFAATSSGQPGMNFSLNLLGDNASNNFLTFTDATTPAKVITMAHDSSAPSLTTTVTNGTLTSTVEQGYYYLNITGGNPATTQGTISVATNVVMSQIDSVTGRTGTMVAEANGPYDDTIGSKPTCDVTVRGRRWRTEGGAGVADTYEVCTKDAANVYAWRSLLP